MTDDKSDNPSPRAISRRAMMSLLGSGAAVVPLTHLLGCSSTGLITGSGGTNVGGEGGAGGAGGATGSQTGAGGASPTTGWATGGTAAMKDKASYPDPFATPGATSCVATCQATIGPCHTTSPQRADVSDDWDGLPVRLSLRVVDESCKPVVNAIVEIWHTNYKGLYSGDINTMCNPEGADKETEYFRGYLVTDADGRVDFDTCFPGWYSSRAVHIHYRIIQGAYDPADNATASLISQLFFTDKLVTAIFTNEPLYSDFGTPDTMLATDNVVGGEADKSPYICDVAQMSDGAMLASKTIILSSGAVCTAQGASGGGPGGPGGPGGTPPFMRRR